MSECQKCGFDPDAKIHNEMHANSKVYNVLKEPCFCGERAVPIEKAIEIALKYASLSKLEDEAGKV